MSVSCMLHTFLKYRDHYTSNIIVAAPMQCCNYYRRAGNIHAHVHVYIGRELYLADWRISCHTVNIKSANNNYCANRVDSGVAIVPKPPNLYPPIAIFFLFLAIRQILFPSIYLAIRYTCTQCTCIPTPDITVAVLQVICVPTL